MSEIDHSEEKALFEKYWYGARAQNCASYIYMKIFDSHDCWMPRFRRDHFGQLILTLNARFELWKAHEMTDADREKTRNRAIHKFPGQEELIEMLLRPDKGIPKPIKHRPGDVLVGTSEVLVKFKDKTAGTAMRILSSLGITREIRCYPDNKMLLFQNELKVLEQNGIKPEKVDRIHMKVDSKFKKPRGWK